MLAPSWLFCQTALSEGRFVPDIDCLHPGKINIYAKMLLEFFGFVIIEFMDFTCEKVIVPEYTFLDVVAKKYTVAIFVEFAQGYGKIARRDVFEE